MLASNCDKGDNCKNQRKFLKGRIIYREYITIYLYLSKNDLGNYLELLKGSSIQYFGIKSEMGVTGVGNGSIEYRY